MLSNELTDVTLVSEDKKQFKAHKVILSASSSVFKSIISMSDASSPIIFLRGVQSYEIESIMQFIYLGEATFYQERMNEFLNVAKSLDIKEISKDIEIPGNEPHVKFKNQEFDNGNELLATEAKHMKTEESIPYKQGELKPNNENTHTCDQCSYKASKPTNLQRHKKSIHDEIKYPCNHCSY